MSNLNNILKYIIDFIRITGSLLNEDTININAKKNELYIENDELLELLELNDYADPNKKLKIWRALNFIKTEQNRMTKKVVLNNERKRTIVINLEAYYEIKSI